MGFDMGFALMDRLFPLMFLVVFIFIISTIVGSLVSGAKRKHKNDQSPRVTADAKVVSKRMQVGQNRQSSGDNDMMRSYTYSKYFVTFEFESGDRLELPCRRLGLRSARRGRYRQAQLSGHQIPRLPARQCGERRIRDGKRRETVSSLRAGHGNYFARTLDTDTRICYYK